MTPRPAPFDLLLELYGDADMIEIFSPHRVIDTWKQVEAALAQAQADLGIVDQERADAIAAVCADSGSVDPSELWESARNVGYPILGLVRQLDAALPENLRGSLHLGATTQDIMDSGLALQLDSAMQLLESRLRTLGDALAVKVADEALTVMPGRTHGQQAVPTTLGAKLAVYLDEVKRHRTRILACRDDVRRVSLFGAGGTSAAYGEHAGKIRALTAERLGLVDSAVPWHVARDSLVHVSSVAVAAATSAARLAREVADLARTEIGELGETVGHHRGASSTMPQKTNPITSESIIGFAVAARTAVAGLSRAAEAGHERSAGEWQVEWVLLPGLFVNVGSALALANELVSDLAIYRERMHENLHADGGLIMAESAMIKLAPHLGREVAHDVVYELARQSRQGHEAFSTVLRRWLTTQPDLPAINVIADEHAVGQAVQCCETAVSEWRAALEAVPNPWKEQG
ncbi:lyase family protein [Streptomyces tubercidicus]|uniref:lyase family protein n=1 Tax=Streptomyces tubercidicus TaxID=47759 RepID=UPI002E0FCD68|nr:lyase family protein [Streptomyces tubercidicus]